MLKLFSYDAHISYVIWDDIAVDFRFSLSIWHAKLDGETVNPRPGIVGHFAWNVKSEVDEEWEGTEGEEHILQLLPWMEGGTMKKRQLFMRSLRRSRNRVQKAIILLWSYSKKQHEQNLPNLKPAFWPISVSLNFDSSQAFKVKGSLLLEDPKSRLFLSDFLSLAKVHLFAADNYRTKFYKSFRAIAPDQLWFWCQVSWFHWLCHVN